MKETSCLMYLPSATIRHLLINSDFAKSARSLDLNMTRALPVSYVLNSLHEWVHVNFPSF